MTGADKGIDISKDLAKGLRKEMKPKELKELQDEKKSEEEKLDTLVDIGDRVKDDPETKRKINKNIFEMLNNWIKNKWILFIPLVIGVVSQIFEMIFYWAGGPILTVAVLIEYYSAITVSALVYGTAFFFYYYFISEFLNNLYKQKKYFLMALAILFIAGYHIVAGMAYGNFLEKFEFDFMQTSSDREHG